MAPQLVETPFEPATRGVHVIGDALRVFNDSWDDYEFEIIIVTDIANPMALTISNSEEYSTFFAGTYRFITKDDRLYFKRRAGHAPITGSVRIESLRLRVAHYE